MTASRCLESMLATEVLQGHLSRWNPQFYPAPLKVKVAKACSIEYIGLGKMLFPDVSAQEFFRKHAHICSFRKPLPCDYTTDHIPEHIPQSKPRLQRGIPLTAISIGATINEYQCCVPLCWNIDNIYYVTGIRN